MASAGQSGNQRWFLATLLLSCATILAVIFSLWELVEHRYFRDLDYTTLHYLYITRGITSSLLIALWASWFVLRERRRHEEELERSREHYRSILGSTPEAVVVFDETFKVAEWNGAAEQLYGLERDWAVGKKLSTVPADHWEELERVCERVREQGVVLDFETERCTARGDRIPVAASYSRMSYSDGEPDLFLEVAQDIRPRLHLRDKLLEVEKLTLMGKMAAGTAHHLNTPLTAMLLQIEMLRREAQSAETAEELASVEKRIRFCQVFVQNLLSFAHRSRLEKKPISLCEVIQAVSTLFRPNLKLKRAGLTVDLGGLQPCRLLGDPNHLEAMFSALLSNAVDAIPEAGSIRIHGHFGEDTYIRVFIEDNGPGLPKQLEGRLFEPFFTTKPAGKGTGLGLAIARGIAEDHGGTLHLENRAEGGVRVTVALPRLAAKPNPSLVGRESVV